MPKRVYAPTSERENQSPQSVSRSSLTAHPSRATHSSLSFFPFVPHARSTPARTTTTTARFPIEIDRRSGTARESIARPHLALLRASSSVPLASRASRPTALARHRSRARIFTSPRRVHDRLARRRRRRRRPESARPSAIRERWARARMRRHASESGSESTRRDARRPRRDARDGTRSASSYLGALR